MRRLNQLRSAAQLLLIVGTCITSLSSPAGADSVYAINRDALSALESVQAKSKELYERGVESRKQGDIPQAILCCEKAASLEPSETLYTVELVELWELVVKANPTATQNHLGLAHAYFRQRDPFKARAEVMEALALSPNDEAAKELLKSISLGEELMLFGLKSSKLLKSKLNWAAHDDRWFTYARGTMNKNGKCSLAIIYLDMPPEPTKSFYDLIDKTTFPNFPQSLDSSNVNISLLSQLSTNAPKIEPELPGDRTEYKMSPVMR
ncbi:MAG: tetratricopeptide repeat protein [Candidatus Obscuribacterales bacterium]